MSESVIQDQQRRTEAEYRNLTPITYPELMKVVHQWMLLADPGVVKLVLACLVANHLPTDSVWLFLIAPSGGGKTEILQALEGIPETLHISSLTENTFASGFGANGKSSLLVEIGNKPATIIFKDFTSITEMEYQKRSDIFGQFREIYDGKYTKRFGGSTSGVPWKGRISIIGGATPMLEHRLQEIGALGERFLNYSMAQPSRADIKRRIYKNAGHRNEMRDALKDAFARCFKGITIPQELPDLSEPIVAQLEALADFIAFSRSVVLRDSSFDRNIKYVAPPEQSSRVFMQLINVMQALAIIESDVPDEDISIVRKIAKSSVHSIRLALIELLAKYQTPLRTSTAAIAVSYPSKTIQAYLEDLTAIGICKRLKMGTANSSANLWQMTDEFREIHEKAFGSPAQMLDDDLYTPDQEVIAEEYNPSKEYNSYVEMADDPKRFL